MPKPIINHRGIALYMVLGTLLVVIVLANVVLSIILSQSRLTHHQVSRIQAYYASQAGMNYALEMLRQGTAGWDPGTTHNLLNIDPDFPNSIKSINITIDPQITDINNPFYNTYPIHVTVDYSYP